MRWMGQMEQKPGEPALCTTPPLYAPPFMRCLGGREWWVWPTEWGYTECSRFRSMEILRHMWRSMETCGNLWRSMEIYGGLWRSVASLQAHTGIRYRRAIAFKSLRRSSHIHSAATIVRRDWAELTRKASRCLTANVEGMEYGSFDYLWTHTV